MYSPLEFVLVSAKLPSLSTAILFVETSSNFTVISDNNWSLASLCPFESVSNHAVPLIKHFVSSETVPLNMCVVVAVVAFKSVSNDHSAVAKFVNVFTSKISFVSRTFVTSLITIFSPGSR